MKKFEYHNSQELHQKSEMKTLFVSPPTGGTAEAYLVESQTVVQLAMEDISTLKIGRSGQHLVITAPGQPDILLLNFISAATADSPPTLKTLDGKIHSAQSLLDRIAFKEAEKEIQDFNDITPAADSHIQVDPSTFGGEGAISPSPIWLQNLSKSLTATNAYNQGKESITFNFEGKIEQPHISMSEKESTTFSPEISIELENGESFLLQTQFQPVDLGNIKQAKIEHIDMKNGEKDILKLDLETVLSISSDDQIRISGDNGDVVVAQDFSATGNVESNYESYLHGTTGAEVLIELGLDVETTNVV